MKIICNLIDAVYLKVIPSNFTIQKELIRFFSRKVPGYQFMPKYKQGVWDGTIKFYRQNKLPIGLYPELKKFCKLGNYKIILKSKFKKERIEKEEIKQFIDYLNLPYELYDYQFESIYESLNKTRLTNILPTASGKSLIIYVITRYLFEVKNYNILIIVPRIQLVEQLFDNFKEYGCKDTDKFIGKIYSQAKNKYEDRPIIISTWQSLQKRKSEYFKRFNVLIIDEAHSVKNMNNLVKISSYCVNAYYRLGFTGTLNDDEKFADYFAVKGYLGPDKKYVDYKTLIENKSISNFKINVIKIDYPHSERIKFLRFIQSKDFNNQYQAEMYFFLKHKMKISVILNLLEKLNKNTIVLFTRIEQGKELYKKAKKKFKDKKILYVDGSIPVEQREEFKKAMELNDNVILFASYGTFAEGINIKNVHYIIFASAYKSKIKTLQSIGRGLRQYPNKKLIVYDLVDDLSLEDIGFSNFSLKHALKRIDIYKKENLDFDTKTIRIKDE